MKGNLLISGLIETDLSDASRPRRTLPRRERRSRSLISQLQLYRRILYLKIPLVRLCLNQDSPSRFRGKTFRPFGMTIISNLAQVGLTQVSLT